MMIAKCGAQGWRECEWLTIMGVLSCGKNLNETIDLSYIHDEVWSDSNDNN